MDWKCTGEMATLEKRNALHLGKGDVTQELYILGVAVHSMSPVVQFIYCVSGVMFFFLLYGYIQEWIFRIEGFKPFGWYLTLLQFGFYTLFGTLEMGLSNNWSYRIPFRVYILLAFLTVSTMGLSNTSLGYLNYPTQVIFKSCKLIPVMVGGVLLQGKKYVLLDYLSVACMSVGLVMFTLADSQVQPSFDLFGVLLISLALCADAVIGNVQEKTIKDHSATNTEVVLFSYGIGFVYILLGLAAWGGLSPAYHFCKQHAIQVYGGVFVFSITGYIGINFVLALVRLFGALLAVTITTFRKAVTMVISFIVFTKPFTMNYVYAGSIVLFGILLNVYRKNPDKVNNLMTCCFSKTKVLKQPSEIV